MGDFREKAVFVWCYWDVSFDPKAVADKIVEGGFEAVYVHTNDGQHEASYARLEGGKYVSYLNCTDSLVAELRARGLVIYGWGAPYGVNTDAEIAMMVSQTERYGLEGYVIDAETTWDAQGDVITDTRKIITGYKAACPGVPVAWCWWPLFHVPGGTGVYHSRAILAEAMSCADYGMPMAYWNWSWDPSGVKYLEETVRQWREVTAKPLIIAGRAYNDAYGQATREAVLAFERRARELGAVGMTWWDLQHAVKLPACWQALKETPKFSGPQEEQPMTDWTKYAIGLYARTASWSNASFDFVIGHAGQSWDEPNQYLKPMEELAGKFGQTFGALWDFDVDFYSYKQYQGDDAHWPKVADDFPLQMAMRALASRNPKFVVVRVMSYLNTQTGKSEDPSYISYAAQIFMGRLGDWLAVNKPGCKLVLATSHDWITAHAPNINNWGWKYPTMVVQKATLPLVTNAYPQETDRVRNYISTRPTNEFWWYYDTEAVDLVLFSAGERAKFAEWVGAVVKDTTPPSVPGGLAATVEGSSIALSWEASTGGAVGYQVYQGGSKLITVTGTSVELPGTFQPGQYAFGVSAFDAAGNESAQAGLAVTVPEPEPVGVGRAEFEGLIARVAELERWRKS